MPFVRNEWGERVLISPQRTDFELPYTPVSETVGQALSDFYRTRVPEEHSEATAAAYARARAAGPNDRQPKPLARKSRPIAVGKWTRWP